jgi:hypothetical protein
MLTLISFSRDRIRRNISFSRGLSRRSQPPIRVLRGNGCAVWTYGLELSGPAEVVYRVDGSPSAWLETKSPVALLRRNATCDNPSWRQEFTYLYVQLSRIAGNRKRAELGLGPLPPLTARSWFSGDGKWKSRCAGRIRIKGPSAIRYSLGRPRPGTGKGDAGVRLWVETRSRIDPGPGGWSGCTSSLRRCSPGATI